VCHRWEQSRPRLIVDYSFSDVNAETVPLAPSEAMQFGRTLQRILTRVVHADPRYDNVHLAKIDLADGFYRVWLQIADIPKLGVVLPTSPGQPPLIAFPLTLPMGWVESPPVLLFPDRDGMRSGQHHAAYTHLTAGTQHGTSTGSGGLHTASRCR
jgi:hypothetical protein